MNKNYMYPMKLIPVLKNIVWGGSRLYSEYGKGDDKNKEIAESWELAIHKNGTNIIENGSFAGHSLEEVFEISNGEIVSRGYKNNSQTPDKFPVLIKFIDAEQDLSVQVHPDNEYAMKNENELGKNEMWYIIDAKPDSEIVFGLKDKFTMEELEAMLRDTENNIGKFAECLNYIKVKAGDVYFIPAGLIHAIGKGILVAEVQQNSDTTYRVYDYDRLVDGKKRELHIEKAMDVCIKSKTVPANSQNERIIEAKEGYNVEILAKCEYFTVKKYSVSSEVNLQVNEISFDSIICLDGSADIKFGETKYKMAKGTSYFLPAGLGKYTIFGNCTFLLVYIA